MFPVQVLSFETGRPLTRVNMADHGAVYLDVDNNGKLDVVKADFSNGQCQALAYTVQTRPTKIYAGTLGQEPVKSMHTRAW